MTTTPGKSRLSRKGRILALLLTAVLGVTVALALLEALLRLVPVGEPGLTAYIQGRTALGAEAVHVLFQYDATLGWRGLPRATATFGYPGEFETRVETNSRGFRDRDHPQKPPPNTFRVLLLGDSFTWGHGVEQADSFGPVLEGMLAPLLGQRGRQAEVVNMGINGYSTDQEYLLWTTEGVDYQPNLVVLQFYPANDVVYNGLPTAEGKAKPMFSYNPEQGLALSSTPRAGPPATAGLPSTPLTAAKEWLGEHSRAYQAFTRGLKAIPFVNALFQRTGLVTEVRPPGYEGPEWERAIAVTQALVKKLRDAVKASGAHFLLLYAPADVEVVAPDKAQHLLRLRQRLSLENILSSAEFVDPTAPLRAAYETGAALYLPKTTHWTARGHRIVAEALYQHGLSYGLLDVR